MAAYTVIGGFFGRNYNPVFTPLLTLLAFTFALLHGGQRLGWRQALLLLGLTFSVSLEEDAFIDVLQRLANK